MHIAYLRDSTANFPIVCSTKNRSRKAPKTTSDSVGIEALLSPGIAVHVVTVLFPEAGRI